MSLSPRTGWACLGLMGWLAMPALFGQESILDAATDVDKILVLQKDGKVEFSSSTEAPPELQSCLSEVVEKFLFRAMVDEEEVHNPPKYSDFIYLFPGDDVGVLNKDGEAKSEKSDDLPPDIRRAFQ